MTDLEQAAAVVIGLSGFQVGDRVEVSAANSTIRPSGVGVIDWAPTTRAVYQVRFPSGDHSYYYASEMTLAD